MKYAITDRSDIYAAVTEIADRHLRKNHLQRAYDATQVSRLALEMGRETIVMYTEIFQKVADILDAERTHVHAAAAEGMQVLSSLLASPQERGAEELDGAVDV